MKVHFYFLSLLMLSAGLAAAPLKRDLGEGLVYYRVRVLPADLPDTQGAKKQPTVLDLRYVEGGPAEALALQAWLKFHASKRTPVIVLTNPQTAHGLVRPIVPPEPRQGIIVIGSGEGAAKADLVVSISAPDERRAYDALQNDVALTVLLTDNPNKPRNDEARLARDYALDQPPGGEAVRPTPPTNDEEKTAQAKASLPPIDRALQRAVHVHRGLLALRKL